MLVKEGAMNKFCKRIAVLFALVTGIATLFVLSGCKKDDGDGVITEFIEEIHISSKEDLVKMQRNEGAGYVRFVLDNDIDCGGLSYDAGVLCGQLDGQGHVIKNIKIRSSNNAYGLFRSIDNGGTYQHSIVNVGLVDFTMEVRSNAEEIYAGAFVGFLEGERQAHLQVSNCYARGSITVNNSFTNKTSNGYIGGFFGYTEHLSIENCHSDVSIDTSGSKNAWKYYLGGFIGKVWDTTKISHSVFEGEIISGATSKTLYGEGEAISYAGGFVGYAEWGAKVEACLSLADKYVGRNQSTFVVNPVCATWTEQSDGDKGVEYTRTYYAVQTMWTGEQVELYYPNGEGAWHFTYYKGVTKLGDTGTAVYEDHKSTLTEKPFMTGTATYKNKYGEDCNSELDFSEELWVFSGLALRLKAFAGVS